MAKAHFKTHILLKNIIGKDLITDDNIAVLELAKNSFDAGSERVEIIFKNIMSNDDNDKKELPSLSSSKLIIKDTGIGMSESDIVDKWLNIAYSEKKTVKEGYGRILAGNKGVGRFSCDRLGRFLTIYTRKKGDDDKSYKKLFIDWAKFEVEGIIDFKIQDIELEIETITPDTFELVTGYKSFINGTILEISYLREKWPAEKILGLKKQLERFINPNQMFNATTFDISIKAVELLRYDESQEKHNRVNGVIKNKIFDKLNFKTTTIKSYIDSEGKFIVTTLQDRGKEIFSIKEKNTFTLLNNITINIYYLNTYSKVYFTKQTGIRSYTFGSIFLFINGFRIPPYGDFGDDWLGMESRKGQAYARNLGTREVVGRIEINGENQEQFKIISNRSGVVNNETFKQLTDKSDGYYYKIFKRLERFVVKGIKWDSTFEDSQVVETKVSSNNWNENKEKYIEDSLTRNKRVLSLIENIVGAKKTDLVSLDLNEEFINDIVQEQSNKAKLELDSILKEFEDKAEKISPSDIINILSKVSKNSKELDAFSNNIANYSLKKEDEIKNFQSIRDSYEESYAKIFNQKQELEYKLQLEEIENKKINDEKRKLEEEKKRIELDLELEKEKNTYLLTSSRRLSEDAKGLIHNIKQTSKQINANVESLYDAIKGGDTRGKVILDKLSTIKYNTDKVLKISTLITRANFKADKTNQTIDLVKYISQYVDIYSDIYDKTQLSFKVIDNSTSYIKFISALDVALVFDDLISNSEKASAKNVLIEIYSPSPNLLTVIFSDDGIGLDKKFLSNPKVIFDLGVTTTDGSGIGLNSAKKALAKMHAEIKFIGNNIALSGASFEITFTK